MIVAIACLQLAAGLPADLSEPTGDYPGGLLSEAAVTRALLFSANRLSKTALSTSPELYPKNTSGYKVWVLHPSSDWSAGFFPGANWLMYEVTGEAAFRTWAEAWLVDLAGQRFNTTTHDLGFMFMTGFGNGHRLTGNPTYRDVMLEAALSLSTRYSPTVGCIRSWSWGPWSFPVIIDNLMNLELLFWAARNGGPVELRDIAHTHALTTLAQHVRPDGSTFHLVDFDPGTGEVIARTTWSGASAQSTWARGQAWAVYGFTMAHRETSDPVLLDAAQRTADYFIAGLPADSIPYWDFDAPGIPNTERDTSAASVAAAGLLELSTFAEGRARRRAYFHAAQRILASLAKPKFRGGYLALDAQGAALSPGILMHGCAGHPSSVSGANLPDESLIYGDYYFLEALLRYKALGTPRVRRVTEPPEPL